MSADRELEIAVSRNVAVRIRHLPAYDTLSATIKAQRPFRMYATAEGRLNSRNHREWVYLTHHEGDDRYLLWIGSSHFYLPMTSLEKLRALVALDLIEYDANGKRVANTPAGAERIAEAG